MTDKPCVLVLGSTGLFGERLAERIAKEGVFSLVASGRKSSSLEMLQRRVQCDVAIMDRDDPNAVTQILALHKPFAVVDCAGPFQYYGSDPYRFARQVLDAGSHYIDIADASAFVAGFSELDTDVKARQLMAITGASSTPAISAAAADVLCDSLQRVIAIETAIIPGNRARRTFSVMKAILGQVGQPFTITRFGQSEVVCGWSEAREINLALPIEKPIRGRLASLIDTPDVELFPKRYGAETVTFSAGLEIKLFHRSLAVAMLFVRRGLISTLAPLASVLRWIASGFLHLGSDIGGMQVSVTGVTKEGVTVLRNWELVADDGRGPEIPTLSVSVLLEKLRKGTFKPGARAVPGEVSLADLEPHFAAIGARTAVSEQVLQPIFKKALGESFALLPPVVRGLHNRLGRTVYVGTALSKGPTGLSGRLGAWINRFPAAGANVSVKVTVTADADSETWLRDFNGVLFKSHLSLDADGYIQERFGFLTARLGLNCRGNQLHFPVLKAKLFGVLPVPRFLLPISIAHESFDGQGRFVFDVLIKTPFGARIAHYKGWLTRQDD